MTRYEDSGRPDHRYRRKIRFFADWGADSPLWENGTDTYLMAPRDYGLSESLTQRLYAWCDHWRSHHHWETGWDDPASEEKSRRDGDALIEDLRREVAAFAEVIDER